MRTYEATHPWLKFSVNLEPANPELWLMFGECQSKCEHLWNVPLLPEVAKDLHRMYVAKGVLATTAIEGNTLTEEEVKKYLSGELKLPPSREYLGQEIDNIADECNRLYDEVKAGNQLKLTTERIQEINHRVLENLPLDEGIVPGEIRHHEVIVALYKGAPAEDCKFLLDKLCEWLNDDILFGTASHPRAIVNGIIKAILAHLYLAWIHPFGDGNGRTARLVEFQILMAAGIPAPAAHLLSTHYNLTRAEYYRQLHYASRSNGDVLPFINYAVQGFLDGLRGQIARIRQQVLDVVWKAHVHHLFKDKTGAADIRRRDLLQDLSDEPEPVEYLDLFTLSHRVAKYYASKTPKTLTRDLIKLINEGLLRVIPKGDKTMVEARKEMVLSFLPLRALPPKSQVTMRVGRRGRPRQLSLPTEPNQPSNPELVEA